MIEPTQLLDNLNRKVATGVTSSTTNPATGAEAGIEVNIGGGGASVKDVSRNRTDYEIRSPQLLPVRVGGGFSTDRQTQGVNGGHIGGGVGTKGVGANVDVGVRNCQVNVDISGGVSFGGAPPAHVGFSAPLPFCNSGTPKTPHTETPKSENYNLPIPLPDSSPCGNDDAWVVMAVVNTSIISKNDGLYGYNGTGDGLRTGSSIYVAKVGQIEFLAPGDHELTRIEYSSGGGYREFKTWADFKVISTVNTTIRINRNSAIFNENVDSYAWYDYSSSQDQPDTQEEYFIRSEYGWFGATSLRSSSSFLGLCSASTRFGALWYGPWSAFKEVESRGIPWALKSKTFTVNVQTEKYGRIVGIVPRNSSAPPPIKFPSVMAPRQMSPDSLYYNWFYGWDEYYTGPGFYTLNLKIFEFTFQICCGGVCRYDDGDKINKPPRPPMDCCSTSIRQNREIQQQQDDIKDKQDKHDEDLEDLKKKVAKLLTLAEELHKVVNPSEFLDGKTSIPKRFIYPGGQGQEPIKDLPAYLENLYRFIDKCLGNTEIEIKIAEANPDKGIKEPFYVKFASLGDAVKSLVEHVIESEVETTTLVNLNIRHAFALMQLLKTSTSTYYLAENLEHYLDYHVKHDKSTIKMPYNPNINLDTGKGFGGTGKADIDNLDKQSVKKLLVQLLQEGSTDIEVTEIQEKKLFSEMILEVLKYASAAAQSLAHEYSGESKLKSFLDSTLIAKHLTDFQIRENVRQVVEVGDMSLYTTDLNIQNQGTVPSEEKTDTRPTGKSPRIKKVSKNQSRKNRGR